MSSSEQVAQVHYNVPQLRGALVRAHIEVFVASRRTGKTDGVQAERSSWNAFRMVRSLGAFVAPSYKKFLRDFIPSLRTGYERLGYIEGRDYVIGQRGPKAWQVPHGAPARWEFGMHWRSGSGIMFISQDRSGSSNGLTLDYLNIDEARLIKVDQLEEETMPTLSGHPEYFKEFSEHKSVVITTDKSRNPAGRWYERYKQHHTADVLEGIWACHSEIKVLEDAIASGTLSAGSISTYQSNIRWWQDKLEKLRALAVYYHEGNTLDNIDYVGADYILQQQKVLSPEGFKLSILNEDVDYVEGGFYPDLDDEQHTYVPAVTSWTTARGYDQERLTSVDCRHDAEIIPSLPLDIALDYGHHFNCMAIGQYLDRRMRVDNGLHVYHPQMVAHLLDKFLVYYRNHATKQVYYHFDHTALQGSGHSSSTYRDLVVEKLQQGGWEVIEVYIGHTPKPSIRYEMWGQKLRDPERPVTFNRDNCADMLVSMHMTGVKEGHDGFKKDKDPERDRNLDQAQAPHYGDAVDTLVSGRFEYLGHQVSLPTPSLFG